MLPQFEQKFSDKRRALLEKLQADRFLHNHKNFFERHCQIGRIRLKKAAV